MSDIAALSERILGTLWRHAPVSATYLGIHRHDHLLGAFSPEALDAQAAELRAHLSEIAQFRARRPGPDPDARLDLDLLEGELRTLLRTHEDVRAPFRNPGGYLEEATFGVYLLMLRQHAPAPERAGSVAARMREVPRLLQEARRNLDASEEVPLLWAQMSLDLGASTLEFLGEAAQWCADEAPARSAEVAQAASLARQAVLDYLDFVRGRVVPRARGSFAVGKDHFEFLLREAHGLSDRIEDLEAFGRQEIAATQHQLKEAAARTSGKPWEEQVEEFHRDVPSPARLVEAYREEIEKARRFVREQGLLDLPSGESLEVVETPVFERKTTPFAAYVPPAPFAEAQRGFFWVTPPDTTLSEAEQRQQIKEHMLPSIPITCVHEGYPGHHAQFTLANRAASWPRRQISTPVMVEGWALYCEEMMGEQGFYADPRTRLLQLKDYLWRCTRVVIDTGLHTGGLSFDEAVRLLVEVAKINPVSAAGEVKRYSKTPTQPMSYAVGKREITRLRDDVRRREGSSFSLKSFHHRLLQDGSIPIRLVRERILPEAQA
jgi:uncharacterized protein (DUF885 family)